ncbi:MAG: Hpt domain-containing protein [Elusimicrobia bacterium]|nr:Hpt domain-containing protein [Elusimicrobiota bacterium]
MAKQIIKVDEDLKDLVPLYLQNWTGQLDVISALLEKNDFKELKAIGHKLHGSGGGFGFDFLTELGKRMELSALACDKAALTAQAGELKDYLGAIEVEYVPMG